jgi:hypothetical protein
LESRGCQDMSKDLDIEKCSKHPWFYGGNGDVYHGYMKGGVEVAIKTMRHLSQKEGHNAMLKVSRIRSYIPSRVEFLSECRARAIHMVQV